MQYNGALSGKSMCSNLVYDNLTHGDKVLSLAHPLIMGIVNITTDSFSDGGRYLNLDAMLYQVEKLLQDGVDILDLGAESTRPNADVVPSDIQIERLVPAIKAIRTHFGDVWLSIDTSCPKVFSATHAVGADIWNDVRSLSYDGAPQLAADLGVPVVLMHHRGDSYTMDSLANYDNPVAQIKKELDDMVQRAKNFGVRQIIIDVGMGFAKNHAHHMALMQNLHAFGKYPMLFGVSRKRFVGELLRLQGIDDNQRAKDSMGAYLAMQAMAQGARIVRVHDAYHVNIARAYLASFG